MVCVIAGDCSPIFLLFAGVYAAYNLQSCAIADGGRQTIQNKCHTKKYSHFVLFSCIRRRFSQSHLISQKIKIIFFWMDGVYFHNKFI